jgi:RHS repeat-associated protein
VYDGDGKRVKSTFNGTTTTYFVGAHFELTGSTVTKYYYAGSQRIAMRSGTWDFNNPVTGTLNFLLGDHLGSTSLTTDAAGTIVSEIRYKAWGTVRYATEDVPTRYQYTGQYSYEAEFGLYFYNARWYDPVLSRFAQADSIIPGGMQGLDRYAYVSNSPVNHTDPSGHKCVPVEECEGFKYGSGLSSIGIWKGAIKNKFGVTLSGQWTSTSARAMYYALTDVNIMFRGTLKSLIGGTTLDYESQASGTYGGTTRWDGSGITFRFDSSQTAPYHNVYHEVAHLINIRFGNFFTDALDNSSVYTVDGEFVMGRRNGNYDRQTGLGYTSADVCDPYWNGCSIDAEQHPGNINSTSEWGMVGNTANEEWADLVANYASDNLSDDNAGRARESWIINILQTFFEGPPNAK